MPLPARLEIQKVSLSRTRNAWIFIQQIDPRTCSWARAAPLFWQVGGVPGLREPNTAKVRHTKATQALELRDVLILVHFLKIRAEQNYAEKKILRGKRKPCQTLKKGACKITHYQRIPLFWIATFPLRSSALVAEVEAQWTTLTCWASPSRWFSLLSYIVAVQGWTMWCKIGDNSWCLVQLPSVVLSAWVSFATKWIFSTLFKKPVPTPPQKNIYLKNKYITIYIYYTHNSETRLAACSKKFPHFASLHLLSSDLFSSDSCHLCFSTFHIVGSFTSKLPSISFNNLFELIEVMEHGCIQGKHKFHNFDKFIYMCYNCYKYHNFLITSASTKAQYSR